MTCLRREIPLLSILFSFILAYISHPNLGILSLPNVNIRSSVTMNEEEYPPGIPNERKTEIRKEYYKKRMKLVLDFFISHSWSTWEVLGSLGRGRRKDRKRQDVETQSE